MASVSLLHLSFFFFFFFFSSSYSHSSPLFLPLTKHPHTNQHLTHLFHTNLVLDLNSPFLWTTTTTTTLPFSIPILRRSIHCSAAGFHHSRPSDHLCTLSIKNPITGDTGLGHLLALDHFLYISAPSTSTLLSGFPTCAKGVLGLGRNRVGLVQQLSHSFGFPNKFSLCLSPSTNGNGMILFGLNQNPHFGLGLFNSMLYTPILTMADDSYHIKLKSVKVQNKKLPLQNLTSIQISTITPYTLMETKIYKAIINAFAAGIGIMKMNRVNPVGQFELCYEIKESNKVPVIDLVLQSEMVKWRIYGHNSMVKLNDKVMCLGILDGGEELNASIVLGIHQLQDHLLDFDLGNLMIGFTSSLLINQSTCSQLTSSVAKHVQSLYNTNSCL